MSDSLFLITGGGTGAKIAEAFVHLCAAGVGPSEAHVLVIDTDTSNGNLERAAKTAEDYKALQNDNWSVQTTAQQGSRFNPFGSSEDVGTELFSTKMHLYQLTKPLETVEEGGLEVMVNGTSDMNHVVDLLFDEDEQQTDCTEGFRARPNLGCLLLGNHLNQRLDRGEPAQFLDALASAVAGATTPVPIVVATSVFGGTGASLLPIIKGNVEQVLNRRSDVMVDPGHMHWSAVKILPHYRPQRREKSVDPDRYPLDTAAALQYYSKAYKNNEDTYEGVYIIGSDNPSRNTVATQTGEKEQSNPSYFEEFLAALAVIDAPRHREPGATAQPVRVFIPGMSSITWTDLPYPDGEQLRDRFAYLMHMAAFYHRNDTSATTKQGVAQFWRNMPPERIAQFGWYGPLLDAWAAKQFTAYKNTPKKKRPRMLYSGLDSADINSRRKEVGKYFGRLLLWSRTALRGEDLKLVQYGQRNNYARVYNGMSILGADDINQVLINGERQPIQPGKDNALIRFLRGVLATMTRLKGDDTRIKKKTKKLQLTTEDGAIPLGIQDAHVSQSLREEGLSDIIDGYVRTLPELG